MEVLFDVPVLLSLVPVVLALVAAVRAKNVLGIALYGGQLLVAVGGFLVKVGGGKPKDEK